MLMQSDMVLRLQGEELSHIGGKAEELLFLQKQSVHVPHAFVCPWDVFLSALINRDGTIARLRIQLASLLDADKSYAVRSSANVEDGKAFSFAGQFVSVLDVTGVDGVVAAIERVWESARVEALRPYLHKANLQLDDIKMAVIIQEMVTPVFSGVSFSKNPITGMDETIVEAVQGSGELLVQDGVTPMRWVHKWGDWIVQPPDDPVDDAVIETVVAQTKTLAAAFGAPVDCEWVYDGTAVNFVQIREISTFKNMNVYSNRISREVLPGLIKPLIWSINVPLVNSAWIDIFTEMIGENDIDPDDLSKSFHYRAYFNMSTLGRVFTALGMPTETLELMMGIEGGDEKPRFKPSSQTYGHLPRMLRFAWDKLRYGSYLDKFLPEMNQTFRQFAAIDVTNLDKHGLLKQIDALYAFTKKAAYANIVGPLLMAVYNNMLQKRVENLGVDYVNFDLMHDTPEMEAYDPTIHLARLNAAYRRLDDGVKTAVSAHNYDDFLNMNGSMDIHEFKQDVQAFMTQFGHFSDSGNDFSAVPWHESPDLVLKMITNYERVDSEAQKLGFAQLSVQGVGRWRLQSSYKRARQFRLYREAISYNYTFGYGLFRRFFKALAEHFVADGVLQTWTDIFYLYLDEVQQLAENGSLEDNPMTLVFARRQEMEDAEVAVLPEIIYGDDAPPLETAVVHQNRLQGIPTSRGYHKGPVRVIRSVTEFDKMVPGAVIVIPFSDVSWTPLFTKAGAVIAESGGMLSHSSIVAREYNLPAIVSVNEACRLLSDDMIVYVDGYKGEVTIHQADAEIERLGD